MCLLSASLSLSLGVFGEVQFREALASLQKDFAENSKMIQSTLEAERAVSSLSLSLSLTLSLIIIIIKIS